MKRRIVHLLGALILYSIFNPVCAQSDCYSDHMESVYPVHTIVYYGHFTRLAHAIEYLLANSPHGPNPFTRYLDYCEGNTGYHSNGVVIRHTQHEIAYTSFNAAYTGPTPVDTDGDGILDIHDIDAKQTQKKDQGMVSGQNPLICKNDMENYVSNPINIFNGNNYEEEIDLLFPSAFHAGFVFKRHYNSVSTDDSPMGFGWRHSYNFVMQPNFGGSDQLIEIIDGTGRGIYFDDNDTDGIYTGAFSENSTITTDMDGQYVWTREDGTVYTFDPAGLLVAVTDKNGNVQTLAFNQDNLLETITDQASDRMLTLHYTASGKIDHITGPVTPSVPDGVWVSYTYDENNNLTGVQYADEENSSPASGFDYHYNDTNDVNNLTQKNDLTGTVLSSWEYDNQDQAIENMNNKGTGAFIDYTNPDEVIVTDVYGIAATKYVQEIAGRKKVTTTSLSAGCSSCPDGIYKTSYDSAGNPTQREYHNGRIDTYQDYDAENNPQTIVKAAGTADQKTVLKTYHPAFSTPLTIIEKSVLADESTPDRIKKTIFDYDDPSDPSDTDIPNENPANLICKIIETGFTSDTSGMIVPYEYTTTFAHTAKGQVASIDGPLTGPADTIHFTYDPSTGDLLAITHPITGSITMTYDAAGNVTSTTDYNGVVTTYTYDGRNRRLSSASGSSMSSLSYTAAGKPLTATDRSGRTMDYTYNLKGLLEKIIASNGDYLFFSYDVNTNRVEDSIYSSQGMNTFYRGYDFGDPVTNPDLAAGRPWKNLQRNQADTGTIETVYTYNRGNVSGITTPDNLETTFEYDIFSRITAQTRIMTDLSLQTTTFEYDTHDNLTSITDAENHVTTYVYDDLNRLIRTVSPDTGTTRYTYNETGNVTAVDQNLKSIRYIYDTLGRLTNIDYPADALQNVTLTYDQGTYGIGRLTSIIDPSGSYSFTYNPSGFLIAEEKIISNITYTTQYTYDAAGVLTSITYPSGRIVSYHLDQTGRPDTVTTVKNRIVQTIADNIVYQPFGPLKALTFGNRKSLTMDSDLNYLVKTIESDTLIDLECFRDDLGNIFTVSDNLIPERSRSFGYDDVYQLATASTPLGDFDFTYDDVGNRQTKTHDALTTTYSFISGTNLLDDITGPVPAGFTYNDNGSIISSGTREYFYDLNERLIRVEDQSAVIGQYTYNSLGQRIEKTVNSVTTIYHYDIHGSLIAETGADGIPHKEYVYLGNTPLSMIVYGPADYRSTDLDQDGDVDGGDIARSTGTDLSSMASDFGKVYDPETKMYYYHNSHIGTPVMMTDENGAIVWQADYAPFGSAHIVLNTVENNLRFPGQYYDSETGLHYNYHRYYDPDTGRYLTPDPIGLAGGINPFVYSYNNPINAIDPLGLFTSNFQGNWVINQMQRDMEHLVETKAKPAAKKAAVGFGVTVGTVALAGELGPLAPIAVQGIKTGATSAYMAATTAVVQKPTLVKDTWDFSSGLLFKPGEPEGVYSHLNSLGTLLGTGIKSIYNYFNSFLKSEDDPCD